MRQISTTAHPVADEHPADWTPIDTQVRVRVQRSYRLAGALVFLVGFLSALLTLVAALKILHRCGVV